MKSNLPIWSPFWFWSGDKCPKWAEIPGALKEDPHPSLPFIFQHFPSQADGSCPWPFVSLVNSYWPFPSQCNLAYFRMTSLSSDGFRVLFFFLLSLCSFWYICSHILHFFLSYGPMGSLRTRTGFARLFSVLLSFGAETEASGSP